MAHQEGDEFKAAMVALILSGKTEEALEELGRNYGVRSPAIRVGHHKGTKRVEAVYVQERKTIFFARGENLSNPFVVLHEFYHHLRSRTGEHRGNEKLADEFAISYINAFNRLASKRPADSPL
ncbi:MAG: hypothetical protein JRN39_02170 [Nitrososphaerota archaeon]|nr:hypothetical protein [Nitrososphaerota archaeon]